MPLPSGSPARIMVITAHPVDAFDNSGGTCAEHIAQGDHVTAVICTSGINIHNERLFDELRKPEAERDPEVLRESSEDYAARKKKEAEDSLGCFGIADVIVLPYEDGTYEIEPGMVDDLERIIRDRKPHLIIQQNPRDATAVRDDHALVGVATSHAISRAGRARYDDSSAPGRPTEVYLLGVFGVNAHVYGDHARPDVFIDVTRHFEAKVRAHQSISTQGQHIGWGQKRIEGIEGHCGIFAGTSYAEAFVRLKVPVFDTLPINPKHHADLQISSAESMKNNHQLLGAFVKEADGGWAWGVEAEKI